MAFLAILLAVLSALSACSVWDDCFCVESTPGSCDDVPGCVGSGDDEGGGSCGRAVDQYGLIGPSDSGCNSAWIEMAEYFGRIVQYDDGSLSDCPITQPSFDCYSGLLYPEYVAPGKCMYCPQMDPRINMFEAAMITSTIGADGHWLCYPPKSEWKDATLLGAIPPLDNGQPRCDLLEPPLGKTWTYTELVWAPWGASCLDGQYQCGPKCYNGSTGSEYAGDYNDFFANPPNWNEWEPTCTGEPLVLVEHPTLGVWYQGTTLELNGFDPPWPPNGASWHDPVWTLLDSELTCVGTECAATLDLAAAALKRTNEVLGGMPVDVHEYTVTSNDGSSRTHYHAEILLCEVPSLCSSMGLATGDVFTAIDGAPITAGSVALLLGRIADSVAEETSLRIEVGIARPDGSTSTRGLTIR